MNKFETMDNMNTNFVALSDQELMEMDGGAIFTATVAGVAVWKILVAGGTAFVAGAGLAYYANR